ncbi:hypothetical protein QYM36_017783 [Artemia franciscana]|nr:hypothetical protein QYM36_017783 [Artemia franciscana]
MEVSSLLAGIGIVAMVELPVGQLEQYPEILIVGFASCTTLLVVVHTLALLIGVCILPHVSSIAKMDEMEFAERSPHDSLRFHINIAWTLSTVIGVGLFLIELLFICWMQFLKTSPVASWIATSILVPSIMLFILFVICFYRKLVKAKTSSTIQDLDHVEVVAASFRRASIQSGQYRPNGYTLGELPIKSRRSFSSEYSIPRINRSSSITA